jgi:drug/metabolite transporter (DMT)-like permease
MTTPETTHPAALSRAALAPLAMLFACGVLWGLHFSLAKISAAGNVHPFAMLLWQGLGAFTVIGGVCLFRGRLRRVRRAHLGYYLGCGLSGIAVPSVAMFWAASYLPAGVMAILVSLNVMGTYGLALIMRLERFDWLRVGGIVLGFIAALLIIGPPQSLPSPDMAVWALLALVTPASYSVNNVFVARYRPADADSLVLALGMAGAVLVVATPLVIATGSMYLPGPPWDRVDAAVLGLPLLTGMALAFMFEIVRLAGPVFFSQVSYLIAAGGVLWGMALFNERHSPLIWFALVLMLGGIALVNARVGAGKQKASVLNNKDGESS